MRVLIILLPLHASAIDPAMKVEVVIPGEGSVADLKARYGDSPMVASLLKAYSEASKVGYADSPRTPSTEQVGQLTHLPLALSHYLAAIERADFESQNVAALSAQVGGRPIHWIGWAIREKHLPELLSATKAATERAASRKASWAATCFVRDLLAGLIYYSSPDEMRPLIEVVKQRQPHMLFHKTRDWLPLVEALANQNSRADAIALARAILLAPEPMPSVLDSIGKEGYSRSGIWEQPREDQFGALLKFALTNDGDAFVALLGQETATRATEKGIATVWLGAQAITGRLTHDSLKAAEGWTPLERMEAVQTLARFCPAKEAAVTFRPWLVEGLKAIFGGHDSLKRPLPLAFIAAAGDHLEFQSFLDDAIASRATAQGRFDPPPLWHGLGSVVIAVGSREQQKHFLDAFLDESRRCFEPSVNGYAGEHQSALAKLVPSLPVELRKEAAAACADFFRLIVIDEKKRGNGPNQWNARETLFALISAREHEAMENLADELSAPALAEQKRYHTETPLFIEEMRVLSRFVSGKPSASPRAVVWIRCDNASNDQPELVWEWVLDPAAPEGIDRDRLEGWGLAKGRGFPGADGYSRLALRSDLIRLRNGDYDLVVKAGPTRKSMTEVLRVSGAKAVGVSKPTVRMPASGWLVGTLISRSTQQSFDGDPVPYSLQNPVVKSGAEPDGGTGQATVAPLMPMVEFNMPQLDNSFLVNHGRPLTQFIPIDAKRRYLLTAWTSWDSDASGYPRPSPELQFLHFNYFDENKKPLLNCYDSSLTPLCRDCYSRNLVTRFTQEIMDPIDRFRGDEGGGDGAKIRFLLVTAFHSTAIVAPLFQLRPIELIDN